MHNAHSIGGSVARITLMGTAFVGAGAVLTTCCPALHQPVDWVNRITTRTVDHLSKTPHVGGFFAKNRLLHDHNVKDFLAINALETVVAAVGVTVIGGLAGMRQNGPHGR